MITKPKIKIDIDEAERLAGLGLTREEIASSLGVCYNTLNRRVKENEELEEAIQRGRAKANIFVGSQLMKKIEEGNVTAIIFYLKARCGWKETSRQEITGKDGGPIEADVAPDLSQFTLEQLRAAREILYGSY